MMISNLAVGRLMKPEGFARRRMCMGTRAAHLRTFSLEYFRRVFFLMYLGMLNPKMTKKKFCKIGNNWLGGAKKTILAPKNTFFQYFLKMC